MSATAQSIDFGAWVAQARGVPIEAEIERRDIKLKGHGTERVGPCPKCGGVDRFAINVKKQVFNCRGCDVGGDVIKLVQFLEGYGFREACKVLTGETLSAGAGYSRPRYRPEPQPSTEDEGSAQQHYATAFRRTRTAR